MQNWILEKIVSFLQKHEGCEIVDLKALANGQQAVVQDAFGFRYTVEVKAVARINTDTEGLDTYVPNRGSASFLSSCTKVLQK